MKKDGLAKRLAKQSRMSQAAAADHLDSVVHDILTKLRKGRAVSLPGLGMFTPGKKLNFRFEPKPARRGSRGGKKQ
jgi:nucleoid DNA-binding protein